ncbi:MAG: 4-hydroxy-tetrahydrodipicolinate synthase [Deltaproteobacteria bacterium]|nr:4-hydroxy-tetrahydrodipicolinate synthase [Deltaproteobacteria bacterium]MBW2660443.1 4-hydroxy-tetrahydrodipicolinate synthase [Deltaproteobacteria bacterium]
MYKGCFTALATPFINDTVDYEGLEKLADFQIKNGITGILAVGTTGESPTLTWDEHNKIIEDVVKTTRGKCICIAGTGSNNTKETLESSRHAVNAGAEALLLVDPYYNGPSSLEIRREYVAPVAGAFPNVQIIPYIIPGRTGAQLLPEDIAILKQDFDNVNMVKEATGSIENMKHTRTCCGADFTILSGDDGLTFGMMTDPGIMASGVISVVSNVAPGPVTEMVKLLEQGNQAEAKEILSALEPLFELVTIKTKEKTTYGEVVCRARNPLGIKTLMSVLGMLSGSCRQPLGKMTKNGLEKVIETARKVQSNNPEIFKPVSDFFGVDIDERLNSLSSRKGLCYEKY